MNVDSEYGVDSRYTSDKEKETEAKSLMETRLKKIKNLTQEQIAKAKLMQLRLKMEEYLKNPVLDKHNYFTEFLKLYVDSIYTKRSNFARDIDIASVSLSQVINNHREPKEEFLLKLMIHSEKAYSNVCNFNNKIWYQVYYQKKICETMSSQDKWRPDIEKKVKLSATIG